jgi:RNA polymerase sigma-70 factor (ECF subfamily)
VESLTDDELASRARTGDASAFDALIQRHYPTCLRYAYRMLGDRADAEDAVQEAFLRMVRALPRYDSRDQFRAWLLHILRNRCRSQWTRRAWRAARLRVYHAQAVQPVSLPASDGADTDVQRALARLPARLREAFLLKHVEDLSYVEMEQVTGATQSALKMRVKRACDQMLRYFEDRDA